MSYPFTSFYPSQFSGYPTTFGSYAPSTTLFSGATVVGSQFGTAIPAAQFVNAAPALAAASATGATVVAPTFTAPTFTAPTFAASAFAAPTYAAPTVFGGSSFGFPSAFPAAGFSSFPATAAPTVYGGPSFNNYFAPTTNYSAVGRGGPYLAPTNFGAAPAFNMVSLGGLIGPRNPRSAATVERRRSLSY